MKDKNLRRKPKNLYINIAPLVEVMLVLIIIFMITAPTLNVGVQVDLPKTKAAELNETKTPPLVVSINKDSKIFLEEAEISLDDLIKKLPMILESSKCDTIYIRGDKDLQYGTIMEIMGIISSTGACKVSLISEADSRSNKSTPKANSKKQNRSNKKSRRRR